MNAHADVEHLSAYLDGAVSSRDRAALEGHLASCAECAARKAALEGTIRSLRGLPKITATPSEAQAIRRAVLEGADRSGAPAGVFPGAGRWIASWKVLGALAGAAAVLAGVVSFATLKTPPKTSASRTAPSPTFHSQPSPASAAVPAFANDADVRSYAASLPGVTSVLGTSAPVPAVAAPALPPAEKAGGSAPQTGVVAPNAPLNSGVAPGPAPTSLGSCARAVIPSGAPLLVGGAATYQGAPAWIIAFAPSAASGAPVPEVIVEIRSQAACSLLDTATLTP